MSEQLQQAYNALMVKAPGAAFQKARALYLNKYPLPQADGSAPPVSYTHLRAHET